MRIGAAVIMALVCHLRIANAFVNTSWRRNTWRATSAKHPELPTAWMIAPRIASTNPFSSSKPLSFTARLLSSISDQSDTEIDPYSLEAKQNISKLISSLNHTELDVERTHSSLLRLTEQVLAWNQRLNLVSRKDCTASVIYHRHVFPSVALLPLITSTLANKEDKINIIDVGTGGGFPGLPLALLLPQYQFTLADSVQKKLVAVSEMASELDISNVRIHCGRVEEMYTDNSSNNNNGRREHYKRYDIVLGRSVTALPRFCAWISNLLKEDGKLIYIIGGELEQVVTSHIEGDMPIDSLLQREEGTSDKRALIFGAESVEQIAEESGEKLNVVRSGGQKTKKIQSKTSPSQGKKLAKGEWSKKRNDVKKDRGYDDFKRYEF